MAFSYGSEKLGSGRVEGWCFKFFSSQWKKTCNLAVGESVSLDQTGAYPELAKFRTILR